MDKYHIATVTLKNIPYNDGDVERLLNTILGVYFDVIKVRCVKYEMEEK